MAYTTINKSTDYFNTKLYSGINGTLNVTGVGFKPDFTWIKDRVQADDHAVYDAVRGATKRVRSNQAAAENTQSTGLTSFDSDGFTVGDNGASNGNGGSFAAWNWKANGAGSANTGGTINSTVSVNTTAGFSIVKYTGTGSAGATIGHGLGAKPNVIILKNISNTQQWTSYWSPLGATKFMRFNATDAVGTASNRWNNTEPTTSLFTVGNDGEVNQSGLNHIAYCFAEKQGYSKFGSYVGNGNANGTFVYTGFKPAFVMVKRSSGTENWQMTDSVRDKDVSPNFARLMPNASDAESTNTTWAKIEKFSNGFKLGGTDTVSNGSGSTYIYMAFAEAPLVGTNNVPCTAR